MPQLSIFTGNIGCGKSTLAAKFAKMGHVVVNMDTIQQMFAGGEYGMYKPEQKKVYQSTEDTAIESALNSGLSVVVDRTNMDRKRRERFIEIGKRYAANIVSYNWGPGTENDLANRLKAKRGVPLKQWASVYEYMQKSYEEPSLDEGFHEIIEPPRRYRFFAFDFDGTIVENRFPEIGDIISGTVDRMNALWSDIRNIIIIWTCRGNDFENEMRQFLIKNNIPFDYINENPIVNYGSRKIFANWYHDDRNAPIL